MQDTPAVRVNSYWNPCRGKWYHTGDTTPATDYTGVDKSWLPTFESQLETLTRSLVRWIAAGQCFLIESNGRPGAWFVLQLPAPDDYPSANKRKGGAKATAPTPLPRATMLGPYTSPRFAGASKYMLTFCQACGPRLAIEVALDDPLSQFRLTYWLDQGFVPDARVAAGGAVQLVSPK